MVAFSFRQASCFDATFYFGIVHFSVIYFRCGSNVTGYGPGLSAHLEHYDDQSYDALHFPLSLAVPAAASHCILGGNSGWRGS